MFIIYFQHAEDDLELCLRVLAFLDSLEELLAGDGDDALISFVANHGIGFATTSLPIGKERAVVALPGIGKHAATQIFKHSFLQGKKGTV